MDNIKIGDKFQFNSLTPTPYGMCFRIEVVNINDFREPSMRYGIDIWNQNGLPVGDVKFVGEDFFIKNEGNLIKI